MINNLKRRIIELAAKSSTGQSARVLAQENEGLRRANAVLAKRADVFYTALLSARLTIEREYDGLEPHEVAYQSFAYAVILAALGENKGRPLAAREPNSFRKGNLSDRAEAAYIASSTGRAAQDVYTEMYIYRKEQGAVYQLHGVGR